MKSVMIATPMYGGMCTGHYVVGLINSFVRLQKAGITVLWANIMNESLITRARNELAWQFLQSDCDYLMFIDADISFDGEAIGQLMLSDKDVICGLYPKKEIDWSRIELAAKNNQENLRDFSGAFVLNMTGEDTKSDETGAIEVRHGGTGFMLIKRDVFTRLMDHVPTFRKTTVRDSEGNYTSPLMHEFFATSIDETGALLSEDYHFCDLWRKHGGKIYANPFIKLEHVGTYVYGGNILKAGGNLK